MIVVYAGLYSSFLLITAQAIRINLLAKATAARFAPRRFSISTAYKLSLSDLNLARLKAALTP